MKQKYYKNWNKIQLTSGECVIGSRKKSGLISKWEEN